MLKTKLLIGVIAAAAYAWIGFVGYQMGVTDTTEKNLRADVDSLNQSIVNFNAENKKAGQLNLQLSNTISARVKADAESTKVFSNALAATSHLRFNCLFDDNIMQQISEAADRADHAATSGITFALPSGPPPDE